MVRLQIVIQTSKLNTKKYTWITTDSNIISSGPLVGETNTEGIQRLKLVRRSTERDIFLDETTGESLEPSCLLDSKSLPHLCEARQRKQPDKQLLCSREDEIQTDWTKGPTNGEERTQQTGHRGLSLDQNLAWTTEREIVRIEDRGKTQRDSWMWTESARSCQTARIRGAGGIWDNKMD